MRALLVNPWIYDFAAYDLWSKPAGLLTIASCLRKAGAAVSLIDCLDRKHPALKTSGYRTAASTRYGCGHYYSEPVDKPAILKDIPRAYKRYGLPKELFSRLLGLEPRPDVILVTTGMTYWYPAYQDTIAMLKARFPSSPIVLGGPYPGLCGAHAEHHSGADAVYRGDAIGGIMALISGLTGGRLDPADSGHVVPAYDLYRELDYITLRTSKGCPFRCTYCGWYLIDKDYSRQEPAFVVDMVEYFCKRRGVRNFSFYDDALLYDAERHIVTILEGLIRKRVNAFFHTPNGLHTAFMTRDLAGLLKAAGFIVPRLALETSSPGRQAATGSKTSTEDFLRAAACLAGAGYAAADIGVNILIGLPGQSPEEAEESIRFAGGRGFRIHLEEYAPVPGTPDYKKTGLAPDADPLLHNNCVYGLRHPEQGKRFEELKALARALNSRRASYAASPE